MTASGHKPSHEIGYEFVGNEFDASVRSRMVWRFKVAFKEINDTLSIIEKGDLCFPTLEMPLRAQEIQDE